jgi:hypothetical protein
MGVGLVGETTKGAGNGAGFQPARSIENITVKDVLEMEVGQGDSDIPLPSSDKEDKISLHLRSIGEVLERAPENVSLQKI